jgi:hypothetical protein
MKISQKMISTVAVAAIVVLLMFKLIPFQYSPEPDYYSGPYFFKDKNRLDSLNHALHVAENKSDSLKYAKEKYVGGEESYSGFKGVFGIGTLSGDHSGNQKCISFANIGLKINEEVSKSYLSFHTINGQGYLSKMKFNKTVDGAEVSVVDEKVGYRYSLRDNSILVTFDSELLNALIYAAFFVVMLLLLATFLFALTTFFKFLLSISKNEAFTFDNTSRLRDIALAMLILAFAPIVLNIIVYLIFISIYSSDGITLTYSFWKYDVYYLILAILSYVVYIAFKQAMILQEEQDLTI